MERSATLEESATVVAVEPLRVRSGPVEYVARRAVSCLVAPRVDDEVLVSLLADGRAYVLAVLDRDAVTIDIEVAGDLRLTAAGVVEIAGTEGVRVASGEAVDVAGVRVSIRSTVTSLASDTFDLVGRAATAELSIARVVVERLDGVFDRIFQRAKRSIRIVEEADQLRAGRIEQIAKDAVTTHGRDVITTAEQLVKIDGGQIQIG